MPDAADRHAIDAIRAAARSLTGRYRGTSTRCSSSSVTRIVLLGEASHGTHEFYRIRGEITKRLIREKGFSAVAVEADWPDAWRVNRYVRGRPGDADATEALGGFARFPQWMWRNADVLDFVGWLREHNDRFQTEVEKVGFYGLDLYSLHASMHAVLEYLRVVDPEAAARAAQRYACFDHFGDDPQVYGRATTLGLSPSCERDVLEQLVDLRETAVEHARRDGRVAADARFFAEQNARVVARAEQYYRAMFRSRVGSWNIRDAHMAETLDQLRGFLATQLPSAKVVVWAHNSHLGDARATEMSSHGELNVGQLVREQYGPDAVLVGFTTFDGSVTAARDWDAPAERRLVRPALPGSYEALLHDTVGGNAFLDLRTPGGAGKALGNPRLERAIGVIYRPETERLSHYFTASLPRQFDAVLHYDRTRAVEPLDRRRLGARASCPKPGRSGGLREAGHGDTNAQSQKQDPHVGGDRRRGWPAGRSGVPAARAAWWSSPTEAGAAGLSPRNRSVATALQEGGFATLLFDLLTSAEAAVDADAASTVRHRPPGRPARRGDRLAAASAPNVVHCRIGYFGASTGAAAALVAAAAPARRVAARSCPAAAGPTWR